MLLLFLVLAIWDSNALPYNTDSLKNVLAKQM